MSTPLIADVLCRRPVDFSRGDVIEALREHFQDLSVGALPFRLDGKRGFALDVDGTSVTVLLENQHFDLAALRCWHGHLRDADGPLLDNAAHVVVDAPLAFDTPDILLQASMAVLRVASVICEQPGAHAVLWTPAMSLISAEHFRAYVAKASEHHVPIEILTRIGPFRTGTEDGKPLLGIWAVGLNRFVGRDIEFVPKPLPMYVLINALASAANWLLLKGPVFKDGDTFGVSETERIRVRHRDRGIMVETPVLLMDIETLDPGATRFAN